MEATGSRTVSVATNPADPVSVTERVHVATVDVVIAVRAVGDDLPDSPHLDRGVSDIEGAIHRDLIDAKQLITEAVLEAMDDVPGGPIVEVRVMSGSIEVLALISLALAGLRSYNEFVETVERAVQNTRRVVERVADATLLRNPGQLPAHAATRASFSFSSTAVRHMRELEAPASAAPVERSRLPQFDVRQLVLWGLGVVTFLTALYVAASILLELFAD